MDKVVFLVDNRPADGQSALGTEHGLSMYVEMGGHKILVDMGKSDLFWENSRKLGIDLKGVDFAFISHGHNDHCGGLPHFIGNCPDKRVYFSSRIAGAQYFSSKGGADRAIHIDHNFFDDHIKAGGNLIPVNQSIWITPSVAAIKCNCNKFSTPDGNRYLKKSSGGADRALPDDFDHELSLVFKNEEGLVILSSCSHCGVANIIASAKEFTREHRVRGFVGGFHIVDWAGVSGEVENVVKELEIVAPGAKIWTGHCTGICAENEIYSKMLDIQFFRTGMQVRL